MLVPFHPRYPIETPRLRLRPFVRGDVDAVTAYRGREDVSRYLLDGPMSRDSVIQVLQLRVAETGFEAEGGRIVLAVERRDGGGGTIGELSLILRDLTSRQGELGYILHPDHHGQGFGTEAAGAMLRLGFEAGLHRIYARCAIENLPSARLMERLGMRREAHFREHAFVRGRWDEEYHYAILEDEWRRAPR
jgi:RimJ/RimL family protein N-acetyltransferase